MPAIKGDMYINTHCNYSQPTLIKLDNENIGGHLTPLQCCSKPMESSFTRTVGDFTHSLGRVGIGLLNGGLASPCHKVVIGYMQLLIASELPPHSHYCTLMTLQLLVRDCLGLFVRPKPAYRGRKRK